MLTVMDARKRLGARAVLDGVNLSCTAGEVALIRGPNGSGKSTLLRAISGVLDLDAGDVVIAGHSLRREPERAKEHLGYAPDGLESLPDLRAGELLSLVRALRSLPARLEGDEAEWHSRLGFEDLAQRRLLSLSFGQRKRVALVAALSGSPALLLLDEPSSGLDAEAVTTLVDLILKGRSRGRCHVITTNDGDFGARLGGTLHLFRGGRLLSA
jgi:ABC-type multidrug transport system ATPase subunit